MKPPTDPDLIAISQKFVIYPNSTVPPPEHTRGFQNFSAHSFTRWVHISGGPICTLAYAVSQEGARKLLLDLSISHLAGAFGNALAGLCRWGRDKGRLGMRCLSVTPPLFVRHKAKRRGNGDSDIQLVGGEQSREVGTTEDIV